MEIWNLERLPPGTKVLLLFQYKHYTTFDANYKPRSA